MQEIFRCILKKFVSEGSGTEVMPKNFTTEETEEHRDWLLLPVSAVDHAPDSVAEVQDVEVDEQAYFQAAEPHVREELGFVDRMDRFYGFHFNHHSVFHDQINAVSDFEFLAFVNDRERNLRCDCEAQAPQFMRQAGLISALQEAGPEPGMDFHGSSDGCVCDLVYSK